MAMASAQPWKPRHLLRLEESGLNVADIRKALDTDGYVILRKFFPETVLKKVRTSATRLVDKCFDKLSAEGLATDSLESLPFDRRIAELYRDCLDLAPTLFRHELHEPEFFDLFFHPLLLDLMVELVGAEEIRLFPNYSCRPKLPSSESHNVLWHQDAGLSPDGSPNEAPIEERLRAFGRHPQGWRIINCWTSLVPATVDNGCMLFCPGSHTLGIQQHVAVKQHALTSIGAAGHGKYSTQIDPAVLKQHVGNAVPIETEPGDLVLFNNLLFHSNQPNKTSRVRWSCDWRYQDASCDTHRPEQGHIARSLVDVDAEVQSPQEWASISLK